MIRRTADLLFIIVILTIFMLPMTGLMVPIEPRTPLLENKALVSFPSPFADGFSWKTFPTDFKRYVEDQYGFRKYLSLQGIRIALHLKLPVIKDVILGKGGFLFWAGDHVLDHLRASAPLSNDTLEAFRKIHEARYDYCAERGIKYLFVLPPNKSTVYPEYLPDHISQVLPMSHRQQLVCYLKTHTKIDILDLTPILIQAKPMGRLYFSADTHWNYMGGFIAYQEIIRKLAMWYPDMTPMTLKDFTFGTAIKNDAELARMLGLTWYLEEPYKTFQPIVPYKAKWVDAPPFYKAHGHEFPRLMVFQNSDKTLPKAVMFNDSLAWFLGYFLNEHFSRITYIYRVLGYDNFDPQVIDYEKPDVVISEIGERFFLELPH